MKKKSYFSRRKVVFTLSLTIFFCLLLVLGFLNKPAKNIPSSLNNKELSNLKPILKPSDKGYGENLTKTFKIEDLNGFPVYPGAKFIGKGKIVSCDQDVYADKFYSACSSFTFAWEVNEDSEKIENWYKENKSNSAWKCGPEIGGYYPNYPREMLCQNKNSIYALEFTQHESLEKSMDFHLKIPYEERKPYPLK